MNKIIVIDGREILGTTGRYTRKLLDNLQIIDSKNQYHILLHEEAFDAVPLTNSNFRKHLVSPRKFSFAEQLLLPRAIKSLKPDLVHFPMIHQPFFLGSKTVSTMHDLIPLYFIDPSANPVIYKLRQFIYKHLSRRVANKSSQILVGTHFIKASIQDFAGIPEEKITVIPLSADKISEAPEPVSNLFGKEFIFYIGRAQVHKNLPRLIQAFEALQANNPQLILVLAGKMDAKYALVHEQARQSPAASSILFTGFINEVQLRWLYENAQAYIFPSLSEGFGLPGLEAMAHGCPLVSSNATCLPEVYGDAAHYFDPLKPEDMAQKIAEVLDSPQLRAELVKKGNEQVKKYSWQRMAEQTLDVYVNVLGD